MDSIKIAYFLTSHRELAWKFKGLKLKDLGVRKVEKWVLQA